MTIDEQHRAVRQDCNRAYVVTKAEVKGMEGYPSLAQNYNHEKAMVLRFPPEGAELHFQFQTTEPSRDRSISGVFADWLEDHFDEVLYHSDVEMLDDTRAALTLLIDYLRRRFKREI